ncbi:MAG: AAA family ATPase [Fibrobacteria bacterium]|nr:AAA family ATPase [Fibrobacteria bacterium]
MHRKPLIIRGARQVGKTELVRRFTQKKGLSLVEVNLERYPHLDEEFATMNPDRILREIEIGIGKAAIADKNVLLFIDEIQSSPAAIQCLRYFFEEKPSLPVIAAGSLIEFALARESFSMPVGRVDYCWLGPMTFQEYLVAIGKEHLTKYLSEIVFAPYSVTGDISPLSQTYISQTVHEELIARLRDYFYIGGMPEAVKRYVDTGSPKSVDSVLHQIIQTYMDDFGKYAKDTAFGRLQTVFDFMGTGAGKKIKYINVSSEYKSKQLEEAFQLLSMAQVIIKVKNCKAVYPINAHIHEKGYRPFLVDIGLLRNLSGIEKLSKDELVTAASGTRGIMAEQFICQHFHFIRGFAQKPSTYYWYNSGNNRNAEIDFLLTHEEQVIPVEVKAGKSGTLKSLHQICFQKGFTYAVRFDVNPPSIQKVTVIVRHGNTNHSVGCILLSLPLYMVEQVKTALAQIKEHDKLQ